ncbi:MAG TPA: hypothetical protein VIV11_32285 [Kofleriaceae bacterium]
MAEAVQRFRFKPRYRGLALSAVGIGTTLGGVSLVALGAAFLPLATGAAGIVLGAAYLLSPAWKLEVVVDDEALEVRSPRASRFRLPWNDVKKVIASNTTPTAFVDGGTPEKSLLVPGDGAPAPYDIEGKIELIAAILSHVPPDKVHRVDTLDPKRSA